MEDAGARNPGENFKHTSCPHSCIKLNVETRRPPTSSSSSPSHKIRGQKFAGSGNNGLSLARSLEEPTLPFGGLRLFNLQEKWPQSACLTVAGHGAGREKRRYFTINIRPISCTQSRRTVGGEGVGRIFIFVGTRNLWLTNGRSSFCLEIAR